MGDITVYARAAIAELLRVRKRAGLTQEQVAERMGTTQPVIARLERDVRGAFSLRRFADYALACGHVPCSLLDFDRSGEWPEFHCVPLEEARDCVLTDPQGPLTWRRYVWWKVEKAWAQVEPFPVPSINTNARHPNTPISAS